MRPPFRRDDPVHVARYAWPAALGALGAAWYGSESLRHRREQGEGYALRGEALEVGSDGFLRAAEALTGAPVAARQRGRAPRQRRPDLPRLPGDDPPARSAA